MHCLLSGERLRIALRVDELTVRSHIRHWPHIIRGALMHLCSCLSSMLTTLLHLHCRSLVLRDLSRLHHSVDVRRIGVIRTCEVSVLSLKALHTLHTLHTLHLCCWHTIDGHLAHALMHLWHVLDTHTAHLTWLATRLHTLHRYMRQMIRHRHRKVVRSSNTSHTRSLWHTLHVSRLHRYAVWTNRPSLRIPWVPVCSGLILFETD